MTYTSFEFYVFLLIALFLYYIIPLRFRWVILLMGSIVFYLDMQKDNPWALLVAVLLICVTYGMGLVINHLKEKYPREKNKLKKTVIILAVLITVIPWFFIKNRNLNFSWIAPIGISFYTLQMISYLVDLYEGKICVQKNIAKYALFILFFPQIVQGPIPRYGQLGEQLYQGHRFDEKCFVKGVQLILWGFFLKLMITNRSAIIVNTIFDNPQKYAGWYVAVGGVLYSLQLYTDFLACITISQGVAGVFGIELVDNFKRPYFSTSVKEFWRRWHISLSEWLRDYIYIPLGGSRKGKIPKFINLIITFLVSGIWHGSGIKFLFWGLMHAVYQIVGEITANIKNRMYIRIGLPEQSGVRTAIKRLGVFVWVTLAWIVFRADSLKNGLLMIKSLFTVYNPWIFFDDELLKMGLDWKEWCILTVSTVILISVSRKQEKGLHIRTLILNNPFYVRWGIYIFAVIIIMIFGIYGIGFNAQDFIYGGF